MKENLPEEVWKTLVQAGEVYTRYKVSNYGVVWDIKNNVEVSQVITGEPKYKYVNLIKDSGKRVLRRVNNIVSWTFHGEPPTPKHTSDHIDRDKFNNVEWNLRWASREDQAKNRDCVVRTECGIPLKDYLINLGYNPDDSGIGRYLLNRMRYGDTYTDAVFNWSNFINPYPLSWKPRSFNHSWDYENTWYPSTQSLVESKGNCCTSEFLSRLREGMTIEEALSHRYDRSEEYRFEMDGFFMTKEEHCERLCISYSRILTYISKKGIPFEEAIKIPVKRFIKYSINGIIKRNSEWYRLYNIPARQANGWLNDSEHKGKRNFRDVLDRYNVNTSDMEIYPCDGDVIMYNKPL